MSELAPIFAAIIIGAFTLLTVLINVVSAQVVRRQERNEKHQEWTRDKQIQDVEVIVPTLSRFLGDLSDCLESVETHLNSAYESLNTLDEAKKYNVQAVNLNILRSFLEKYRTDSDVLWRLDTERRAWFGFEAKRRSVWFDEPDVIEQQIDNIGQLLRDFHLSIHEKSSAFRWIIDDLVDEHGKITEENVAKAEDLKRGLVYTLSTWPEINNVVTNFQKVLASKYKYRPAQLGSRPTVQKDGLLVLIARWTERRLRQLLRLR